MSAELDRLNEIIRNQVKNQDDLKIKNFDEVWNLKQKVSDLERQVELTKLNEPKQQPNISYKI